MFWESFFFEALKRKFQALKLTFEAKKKKLSYIFPIIFLKPAPLYRPPRGKRLGSSANSGARKKTKKFKEFWPRPKKKKRKVCPEIVFLFLCRTLRNRPGRNQGVQQRWDGLSVGRVHFDCRSTLV